MTRCSVSSLSRRLSSSLSPEGLPARLGFRRRHHARAAGGGHARSRTALRLCLLVRRAPRRDALEQRDDFVARQSLVFEKPARQRVQIVDALARGLLEYET